MLTLPLSTLRAADSSDCGMTPFSIPNVFTTDDTVDGIDKPCEFSARTRKMYDVAGFSSPICKWKSCYRKCQTKKKIEQCFNFSALHWKIFIPATVLKIKLRSFRTFWTRGLLTSPKLWTEWNWTSSPPSLCCLFCYLIRWSACMCKWEIVYDRFVFVCKSFHRSTVNYTYRDRMTRETMSSNHPASLQIRTEIFDRVSMWSVVIGR